MKISRRFARLVVSVLKVVSQQQKHPGKAGNLAIQRAKALDYGIQPFECYFLGGGRVHLRALANKRSYNYR